MAPIARQCASNVLTCDASQMGWGAAFNGKTANGHFSLLERPYNINIKECLAVLYAIQSFAPYLVNSHVLVMSDNTTAISTFKNMGTMSCQIRDNIARQLWDFLLSNNMWLSITHIPGSLNSEADFESRNFNDNIEWTLPQQTFDKLQDLYSSFGSLECDLFACRLNFKLKPYMSYGPDPGAMHVDAFSVPWAFGFAYAYPPFNLISRVLQKLQHDQTTLLLIFPLWKTQLWFAPLLRLLATSICLIPNDPPVFLPWDLERRHPLNTDLKICSAVVSGNSSSTEAFLSRLSPITSEASPSVAKQGVAWRSKDGCFIAYRNLKIPVNRL